MLRLIAPRALRRTPATSFDELVLDGGRSRVLFNDVSAIKYADSEISRFLVTNHLPPAPTAPSGTDLPNSSLCPPFHIHLREDEKFHVLSGRAKFLLLDQQCQDTPASEAITRDGQTHRIVSSGGTITIPRGQIHTFRNASSDDPLVLEFGFSLPGAQSANESLNAKMKQFFMNTQLYRSDCATQDISRALPQVLLFNNDADVALVPQWLLSVHRHFPWLRVFIENHVAHLLGRLMNVFGGVVLGRWLFGLRSTYEEYYPSDQARFANKVAENISSQSKLSGKEQTTSKSSGADNRGSDNFGNVRNRPNTSAWACQAWRDHSFDGQSDSWRK